jgi:hypothetical protein
MANVRQLERVALGRDGLHRDVECTYSIVVDAHGDRWLQLDTYGSKERKMPGKKSQSIRLAPEAIKQLKLILAEDFSRTP